MPIKKVIVHRTSPGIEVIKVKLKPTQVDHGYYKRRRMEMRYTLRPRGWTYGRVCCANCEKVRWGTLFGRGYYKCTYLGISSSKATDVSLRGKCRKFKFRLDLNPTTQDLEQREMLVSRRLYVKTQEYKELNTPRP